MDAALPGADDDAAFEELVMIATAVSAAEAEEELLPHQGQLVVAAAKPEDDEDAKSAEQAAYVVAAAERLLLGLQPAQATGVCATLRSILSRILQSPDDAAKRRLRLSNAKVLQTVVAVPGAVEFLIACGFVRTADDTAIELHDGDADAVTGAAASRRGGFDAALLTQRTQWLDALAGRAAKCAGQKQVADCVVKLTLPEGASHTLGFGRDETLAQLHALVEHVFWPSLCFQLCQRAPRQVRFLLLRVGRSACVQCVPLLVIISVDTISIRIANISILSLLLSV